MLTQYLDAAMRHAHYEILSDDGSFYSEIPECRGVSAQAGTLEACREELASTLEDWLLFRIHMNLEVPKIDGLDLAIRKVTAA